MEESRVKLILNLEKIPPKDVLTEILEEEIFPIRNYFLRNPVIKVLFKSRIRKLLQYQEIETKYIGEKAHADLKELEKDNTIVGGDFRELFRSFELKMSKLKVRMSSEMAPGRVAILAQEMIDVQEAFELNFVSIYDQWEHSQKIKNDITVKAADQISTGKALRLLTGKVSPELIQMISNEYVRIKSLIS